VLISTIFLRNQYIQVIGMYLLKNYTQLWLHVDNAVERSKMTIKIEGTTYYNTREACKLAGTNRHTFLRWVRQKKFHDVEQRDRNGWRLFTVQDLKRLEAHVNHIEKVTNFKE